MFTYGDFKFVSPMNSKSDGGIGLMSICRDHEIPEELRYDNFKEESMPGTIMQIIMSNFYMIWNSSDLHTQQKNKCEG